jgi:glycosyltransferase involved in cell wall biosynthesis
MTRIYGLLKRKRVDIIQPFLTPATLLGLLPAVVGRTPVKIATERSGANLEVSLSHKAYQKTEDCLARLVDWVVPNSEAGKNSLIKRGINPARIKVIYNGINLERLRPDKNKVAEIRDKMGVPSGGVVIGMNANLSRAKDHVTFLEGARIVHRAVPNTRFALLGDGPLRQELETMVSELEMKSYVTFYGHQLDVASYIDCFDIAGLCSNWDEGCSNSTLEAMSLGKPVVVTDSGGNREMVEDGKTGILVPRRDPQAFADAILRYIRQPDLARNIAETARRMVLDRFSISRMVGEYEQLYEQSIQLKRNGVRSKMGTGKQAIEPE